MNRKDLKFRKFKFILLHRPEEPGYVWDIFQPSVKMSTYLNAFVVSELNSVTSDEALSNVQFRIWARPDAMNQTA